MHISVKVAKLNTVRTFDVESLPATSLQYLITYGLTQAINDAHASVQRKNFKTDEEFYAEVAKKAEKRIAQIYSGDVPGSRGPVDPTRAKAAQLARAMAADPELEAKINALVAESSAAA